MRTAKSVCAALLVLGLGACDKAAEAPPSVAGASVTKHTIHIGAKALDYTAEAGFVGLTEEKSGEVHANMFYSAYTIPGKDRPVAFIWNGGPGSPATWVQFQGFGPKLINGKAFVDNQDTLLPTADMVFIDPIGTGYSRPTKVEYAPEYLSTLGDAASVTQFIINWVKLHKAEGRPIFLIGESFGGYRAGGVTERMESQGHHVAGNILVSGGVASGPLIPPNVRTALTVPQRAAGALALGKTPPELGKNLVEVQKQATQWALSTYLPALTLKDKLNDAEREAIVADLSKFTGYPADKIDRKTMLIGRDFLEVMSPEPGKRLVTYDMRTTDITAFDDSAVTVYLKDELKVKTDLDYWQISTAGAPGVDDPMRAGGKNWVNNYRWPESEKFGRDYAEPWLPKAMEINPNIKVLVVAGQYDFLNSCVENDVLLSMLEPTIARNYTMRCYLGGHMVYRDADTRVVLNRDIQEFMMNTVRK